MNPPPTVAPVILHIGAGSFHRAHQAWYLHRVNQAAAAAGDTAGQWSLVVGNIRDDMRATMDALAAQHGAYTLETVTPQGERAYETIRSITRVLPWSIDLAALVEAGADPACRIVSFTVTEGGYYLDEHNRLDAGNPDLAADLQGARTTIYGALAALLAERQARGAGPLTLQSCDNLRSNGARFEAGMREFLERRGLAGLLAWFDANVSCPSAMVDRITPRPTPDVAERVKAATGVDDACPVMGESFIQWVIEDRFVAGRPAWEQAGAELVQDVHPYEEAKIRILNATHSCIAWAGTLAGLSYIHEGTHDAAIRQLRARLRQRRRDPLAEPEPARPGTVSRRGAGALRQSVHPRHQPARGRRRLLEDPRLHRADPDRLLRARRRAGLDRRAARSVPALPGTLVAGPAALRVPGRRDGPGRGARDRGGRRSGRRAGRRALAVGSSLADDERLARVLRAGLARVDAWFASR